MLEKECKQEENTQNNELLKIRDLTGYHILPVGNDLQHLIRPLYPSSFFPRFHLIITEKDSRLNAALHLDIKHHRGRAFGVSLSEELERLIKIIVIEQNPSIFTAQLLSALKNQALFGTSEAKKRRENTRRLLSAGAKSAKMRKENRAKFLNRKYTSDEYYQLDLE